VKFLKVRGNLNSKHPEKWFKMLKFFGGLNSKIPDRYILNAFSMK
jgi:hypothetical protein